MKTTIERLADDKLRLDIEVPGTMVQEAVDHTLVQMGRSMNMPGFRPGKVPSQMVLARVGKEAAIAEAVNHHLGDWYMHAVSASGIRPVSEPEIDLAELAEPNEPFKFSATVEVAPKPKVPDLSSIEVERPETPDTEPIVQEVLEATIRPAGELEPTGAPAKEGDEVVVDFTCEIDGEPVHGASAQAYQARLGEGRLLQELEQAIIGTEAGAELEVPVQFPPDHPIADLAGQSTTFKLNLREVSGPKLPELTDEVARQVSEFDSAAALRSDIEQRVRDRVEQQIDGVFRANAVNALAEACELKEPQALVDNRRSELYMTVKQRIESSGMTVEAFFDRSGRPQEEFFADLETEARADVRRELCLLAVAEDQDITITEEDIRKEVHEHCQRTGEDEELALQQVFGSGRVNMLRGELLLQRTIDYVVGKVRPVPPRVSPAEDDDKQAE